MMGMLLPEDERFLWIAEESLLAPLPEGKLVYRQTGVDTGVLKWLTSTRALIGDCSRVLITYIFKTEQSVAQQAGCVAHH